MSQDLEINQYLKDNYGTTLEGHPKFRVVWSGNLTEKRFGTFNEHTEGGIFLREVTGVQTVPKYPFSSDRWVLEHFEGLDDTTQKELVENKYSYEPLYVFQDAKGNFLPLKRDICEIIVFFWMNRHLYKKTPYEREAEYELMEEKKKEKMRQLIGENMSSPYFLKDLVE